MASPTRLESEDMIKKATALVENHLAQQTVPTDFDTLLAIVESDFGADIANGAQAFLAQAGSTILSARELFTAVLASYCHHEIGVPERDAARCLDRMYTHFIANSYTVKSRAFTFGAIAAAGGNTGTGTIRRLTKDENNLDLENAHADVKTFRCIGTAQMAGADKHEEVFEFRGTNAPSSILALKSASTIGSGIVARGGEVRAVSSRDSLALNPSFSNYSWTTAPTAGSPQAGVAGDTLTNWTVTDITKVTLDIDSTYRNPLGSTATKATLTGNVTLTQTFETAGISLDPNTPYYREIAYKINSGDPGVLQLDVGSESINVDLSTVGDTNWHVLTPTMDQKLWPAQFDQADADINIQLSSYVSGSVDIDELIIVPMLPIDGLFYTILSMGDGASLAKFALDDEFTFTDTIATDSKIQKMLWILFGRYLPHSATPSIADPT